jgi:predicted amidohydrolase
MQRFAHSSFARSGSRAAGQLVVLPELALTPYFGATVHDRAGLYAAKADNDAAIAAVSAKAKAHAMAIVLPFAELTGNGLYNSMAFIDKSGSHVGTFRKVHIPGFVEPKPNGEVTILEKRYFAPGDLGFGVYDTDPVKLGGLICYDRRFPEAYRSLALNGADIVCVGYNTPVMGATRCRARVAPPNLQCAAAPIPTAPMSSRPARQASKTACVTSAAA